MDIKNPALLQVPHIWGIMLLMHVKVLQEFQVYTRKLVRVWGPEHRSHIFKLVGTLKTKLFPGNILQSLMITSMNNARIL